MVVVTASIIVLVTILVSLIFIVMLYRNFAGQLSSYKGKQQNMCLTNILLLCMYSCMCHE